MKVSRSWISCSVAAVVFAYGYGPSAFADCDPALRTANGGTCPDGAAGTAHAVPPVNPAFDSDCGPVNESDAGGSMEHVPVHDQDGVGICFAEAGAELVDAYRFSHGQTNYDHITSPVAGAIGAGLDHFWTSDRQKEMDGEGLVCPVADYIRSNGTCDYRSVKEGLGGYDLKTSTAKLRTYFDAYRSYVDSHSSYQQARDSVFGDGAIRAARMSLRANLEGQLTQCLQRTGFAPDMIPAPDVMDSLFEQGNPLVYLQGAMTNACRPPHIYSPHTPSCNHGATTETAPAAVAAGINARLSLPNPQPVAINYCASTLTQGRGYEGVTSRWVRGSYGGFGAPTPAVFAANCGAHASLVIGRRRDPGSGKCQYLIRNSWGTSCGSYSADWSCSNGSIWVDVQSVSNNTFGTQYL